MQNYIGQQIDRYRITDRLGMGGMAVVYKAYDTRLERDVALKLIRAEISSSETSNRLIQRFQREAQSMARLMHPNIVQVMDFGEYQGMPYLVMPFLPGGTLKDRTGTPMDFRQAAALIAPIADALSYAHSQGIIHRDVKPANILITESGTPMLSDFGIAKLLEEQDVTLTSTGFGVGTPHYMAPEQVENKVVPQTDVYALGTIFYELVTGKKPYDADTPAAILVKRATEPLVRPRTFIADLPEEVEKVIFKAMAYKPENRYPSMQQFFSVLDNLASGQPTHTPIIADDHYPQVDQKDDFNESMTQDILDSSPPPKQNRLMDRPSPKNRSLPKWTLWVGAVTILVAVICIILGFTLTGLLSGKDNESSQSVRDNVSNTLTESTTSSATLIFTKAPEIINIATTTPWSTNTPGIGSAMINEIDQVDMVYVPAGEFIMGSNDSRVETDERPEHEVYLDAYWIYKNEVSHAKFRECLESGGCSDIHFSVESDDYPMIYVSWNEAQEYCNWAGGRLPTEAEWEKAARGTNGWTYPWGNDYPTSNLANFYIDVVGSTTPVGSYPSGASPYGALDMAGNVMEWVADWYDSDYYQYSPSVDPIGPNSGDHRVFRGSSYYASALKLRVTIRHHRNPLDSYDNLGFRCVVDGN